ncbi:MAG: hypothetical protein K0R39_2424 [Symbiobacteriaceae bacterium]|jgi:hypothetical protein|nr:hypothetical protein [Symbiobacteriaceae bacterium]
MTTTRDIRDLIAENVPDGAERKALEAVAERVGGALSQDVPYRTAYRAELRRKLMAQARRQAPSAWYRRPAVWGSAGAMAAAVGILAVGLTLWNNPSTKSRNEPPVTSPTTPAPGVQPKPHAVSTLPELPRIAVADETLQPGQAGAESLAGVNPAAGLLVYKLGGKPTAEQFGRMAAGLKFTAPPTGEPDGWAVVQGSRSLRLTSDGRVMYLDSTPAPAAGTPTDANGAAQAARQFLLDASLPLQGEPRVKEGQHLFEVTYTRRFEGHPVVNIPTVVKVSDRGAVVEADAYVNFAEAARVTGEVITPDEARAKAQERGGTFRDVDLVYVRTKSNAGDWYMQPYWRLFGSGIVRYVAALK